MSDRPTIPTGRDARAAAPAVRGQHHQEPRQPGALRPCTRAVRQGPRRRRRRRPWSSVLRPSSTCRSPRLPTPRKERREPARSAEGRTCEICGRRLLAGETFAFFDDPVRRKHRRPVCALCQRRARDTGVDAHRRAAPADRRFHAAPPADAPGPPSPVTSARSRRMPGTTRSAVNPIRSPHRWTRGPRRTSPMRGGRATAERRPRAWHARRRGECPRTPCGGRVSARSADNTFCMGHAIAQRTVLAVRHPATLVAVVLARPRSASPCSSIPARGRPSPRWPRATRKRCAP